MLERLKQIRKNAKLTQSEFGEVVGATRGMIAKYETGLVVPDNAMLELICVKFNVSRAWLETGEGQPYVQTELVPELMHALQKYPALKTMMESAADLMTPADWEALNDFAQRWIDRHQARADCPSLPPHCCSTEPVPPTQKA